MHPLAKRCLVYGLATPVVASLCYGGFFYDVPHDPEHALTQAEIKLRFAAQIAARQTDGSEIAVRRTMIAEAIAFVDEAERLAPSSARALEYRAYAEYLRGDVQAAAAGYSRARTLAETAEERGGLALSEGRMLALAGDDAGALQALEVAGSLSAKAGPAASLEKSRILARQQRVTEAVATARATLEMTEITSEDLIETGLFLESQQRNDIAATAYARAAQGNPVAQYFTARLKAKDGQVDNALEMLEFAVRDTEATVRTLVKRDSATWQPCANTARFRKLFPEMDAAQPGR